LAQNATAVAAAGASIQDGARSRKVSDFSRAQVWSYKTP
jgi:hypothetical protein